MTSPDINFRPPGSAFGVSMLDPPCRLEAGEVRVVVAEIAERRLRVDDLAALDDMDGSFKADELVGACEHRGAGRCPSRRRPCFSGASFTLA